MQVQIGATLPEGKQEFLKGKYRYSLWSFGLRDFDSKHQSLSYHLFQMHYHVQQAYFCAVLMKYLWNQIRPAFLPKWQKKYTVMFDKLFQWADEEVQENALFALQAGGNAISQTPSRELVEATWNAYQHLKFLTDKSGYGNRLDKVYDKEETNDTLLG
jgi:hypothetical protein